MIAITLFVLVFPGCTARRPIDYVIPDHYGVSDPQFRRSIGSLLGPGLTPGNSITSLRNGDEIFPSMLQAIHSASQSIDMETYIYWSGNVGTQFTDALCERAQAGVLVHLIIDAIGSDQIDHNDKVKLRGAGVRLEEYHPVNWYELDSDARINNRTHRKLLIVDGRIGFTGGVGIADCWAGHAESPDHWRDMHYRVEGPAVAQLQAAFLDNWMKTTGQVLDGPKYFPELKNIGSSDAQVFKSGVGGGSESMELLFLLSIANARHHIRIGNAYFVPDELTIQSLLDARRRGVQIQIIVPGPHIDVKVVGTASRALWGDLLKQGVEIYEFQPTMYHTKLLIVDDLWVSIGSANLDNRSFRLNDEANLNVMDATFAAKEAAIFDDDLRRCNRISFKQWENRPFWEKLIEGFSDLFSPLL